MGRPDIEAGAGAGLEVWTGTPGSLATLPEAFPNHWERWAPVSEVTPQSHGTAQEGAWPAAPLQGGLCYHQTGRILRQTTEIFFPWSFYFILVGCCVVWYKVYDHFIFLRECIFLH